MTFRTIAAAALCGVALSLTPLADAARAAPIVGGITEVRLDSAPVLGSLGITPGLIGTAAILDTPEIAPGVIVPLVGFPITGGTANGNLVIEHDGSGLTLTRDTNGATAGGVVVVSLANFVIDTAALALTGLVSVDGTDVGTVQLFDISLTGDSAYPFLLSLTSGAATALNGALQVSAFAGGLAVAVANTSPEVLAEVPVPATALLLGATVAPLLAARRRRAA